MSSSTTEPRVAEVTMPQMGVSVAEGTITQWHKRPGDWVERDETIVEISTDKVETEIPSPAAGRVQELLVDEGATVDVGAVLATIETGARAGEAHPDESAQRSADVARQSDVGRPSSGNGAAGRGVAVSPVVRRIADEHGVDLSLVEGTGRRGRVTKRDILGFIEGDAGNKNGGAGRTLHSESPYREEPSDPPTDDRRPPPAEGSDAGEPLSPMRRQIGEHMVRSLQTAAHCTTVVEADMSAVEAARGRFSYLPLVARAVISALREHPRLNSTMEGERLVQHEAVHLGVAVALGDDGLIVPVVRDAHQLSHEGLAERIADLAVRARSKRLDPSEVGDGTFTVTNPGRFGALLATPIINQPQVAILDLEAVTKRPVVVSDGQGRDSIAIRPMTYLCMSWDHRALDGVLAARFLASVRRNLEEWRG